MDIVHHAMFVELVLLLLLLVFVEALASSGQSFLSSVEEKFCTFITISFIDDE